MVEATAIANNNRKSKKLLNKNINFTTHQLGKQQIVAKQMR